MISSFSCEGFRNITTSELEFKQINILIGPNNAGKSNFIRSLTFVPNMITNSDIEATKFLAELKHNGWKNVLDRKRLSDSDNSFFQEAWEIQLKDMDPVKYMMKVHIGDNREDNYIMQESLDSCILPEGKKKPYNYFLCHGEKIGSGMFSSAGMYKKMNNRLKAAVSEYETVLMQIEGLFLDNPSLFSSTYIRKDIVEVLKRMREFFKGFSSYSCTAFNLREITNPQDNQNEGTFLRKDGINFVNVYDYYRDSYKEFEPEFLEIAGKIIFGLEKISISKAGNKIWMELMIDGENYSLAEVSDGTVHLLLLVMLLVMSSIGTVSMLALDEPEMNLHPAWQKLMASMILREQNETQFFLSTHSPDFLDEFNESFKENKVAVFVFDPSKKDKIRLLKPESFGKDLDEWTLGDLYRVADPMIGGWPQ